MNMADVVVLADVVILSMVEMPDTIGVSENDRCGGCR